MQDFLQYIPEVIVVGDIEMLFLGAAGALGMPKMTRKILNKRYGTVEDDAGAETPDSDPRSDSESDGGN